MTNYWRIDEAKVFIVYDEAAHCVLLLFCMSAQIDAVIFGYYIITSRY